MNPLRTAETVLSFQIYCQTKPRMSCSASISIGSLKNCSMGNCEPRQSRADMLADVAFLWPKSKNPYFPWVIRFKKEFIEAPSFSSRVFKVFFSLLSVFLLFIFVNVFFSSFQIFFFCLFLKYLSVVYPKFFTFSTFRTAVVIFECFCVS